MSNPSDASANKTLKKNRRANDFCYRQIVRAARGVTIAQGLQMRVRGEENIPATGGAVLVLNHTGYMDFVLGGFLPRRRHRLVRYLAKSEIFAKTGVGTLMRIMGHISVDRIDGTRSLQAAVEAARAGQLVGIFAEGTISRSFEIRAMRTGAARIAFEAGVPVVPQVIFGSQRLWTKGHERHLGRTNTPIFIHALEPFYPTGDFEADTKEIRRRMQTELEVIWQEYEAEFGPMPAGEYWVPARKGGGAPSLAETETQDKAIESERHRVRRLRDDLTGLKEKVRDISLSLAEATKAKMPGAQSKNQDVEDESGIESTGANTATEATSGAPSDSQDESQTDVTAWVHDNLNAVLDEANRGLGEGKDRISEVLEQLKTDIAEVQEKLAASSKEIYLGSRMEQVLVGAAAQSRVIISRLPSRVKADYSQVPKVVIVDEEAFVYEDGVISTRLRKLFGTLSDQLEYLVLISEGARSHRFDELPQDLWFIENNGALIRHGEEILDSHPLAEETVLAVDQALGDKARVDWQHLADVDAAGVLSANVQLLPEQVREALGRALADELSITQYGQGSIITVEAGTRGAAARTVLHELGIDEETKGEEGETQKVLAFLSQHGDEELSWLNSVALESAPVEVLRDARSVTYSADKDGVAEVLDIIVRQRELRAQESS